MVIDKTTGKGCAWSIVSKTITKKLLAESIMDKPILRKSLKSQCNSLRISKFKDGAYVLWYRGDKLTDEPLWTPSIIDKKIWKKAVSKFQTLVSLDRNVEKHLLPEMGEYLQSIPDTELISMTKDFLVAQSVINSPICQRAGSTYYFNENEIYSLDEKSELFPYEKRIRAYPQIASDGQEGSFSKQ